MASLAVYFLAAAIATGAEPAPPSVDDLLRDAQTAASDGKSDLAVQTLSEVVRREPKRAEAWYLRGRENFRLGKFDASCDDFDEYVRLQPDAASRQWERGISLYYAGRFADGAKQFELYQTYHDNDVENSVWRYLCVARAEGVEKAKQSVLPIANDPRVPMMQVYDLYRGKLKPEDVLAAAGAKTTDPARAKSQQFYAHLYVGLWQEANGNAEESAKQIRLAAAFDEPNRFINRYMWDVARIHAARVRENQSE